MLKDQYDKVKEHIRRQLRELKATVELKAVVSENEKFAKIQKLANEQFLESEFETHQIIRASKKKFSYLEPIVRMIVVCKKSGEFSSREIAEMLNRVALENRHYDRRSVGRIIEKAGLRA